MEQGEGQGIRIHKRKLAVGFSQFLTQGFKTGVSRVQKES